MASPKPSEGGATPCAPRAARPAGRSPRHTLPWWMRLERRTVLSVVKRVASAGARRTVGKVPILELLSKRLLHRFERLEVEVCGAPFRLDVVRRSVSRSVYLGGRWHAPVLAM